MMDWVSGSWTKAFDAGPSASVVIASDWAPIRAFDPVIAGDPEAAYGDLLPVLRDADLRIANLECPLCSGTGAACKSGSVFKGRPAHVRGLTAVPVQAVLRYEDKDHVTVKKPDGAFEQRVVTLGLSNDKVVEVKQGLKNGEAVALNPFSLMSDEWKRAHPARPAQPAAPAAQEAPREKGRGVVRPVPSASVLQKFRSLDAEERAQFKGASPAERAALLKKAGFTSDEIEQFKALRPQTPQKK